MHIYIYIFMFDHEVFLNCVVAQNMNRDVFMQRERGRTCKQRIHHIAVQIKCENESASFPIVCESAEVVNLRIQSDRMLHQPPFAVVPNNAALNLEGTLCLY